MPNLQNTLPAPPKKSPTPDATAACLDGLRQATAHHGRPAELGDLEISVTPVGPLDRATTRQFADLGVHRLIVYRPARNADEALATVDAIAALQTGGGN